jgi:dienelactone hydrolase
MARNRTTPVLEEHVEVQSGRVVLEGDLGIPDKPAGVVLFAHGSGSGRHSPRNRFVAEELRRGGLATLLIDLLTEEEEEEDRYTAQLRFDLDLLSERLVGAADWLLRNRQTAGLPLGLFGASTGAAAALRASVERANAVQAVVSRGGRPDLAQDALPRVRASTLLLVGSNDEAVIRLNRQALSWLPTSTPRKLVLVHGAGHLFEEPGALEEVSRLARDWFHRFLTSPTRSAVEGSGDQNPSPVLRDGVRKNSPFRSQD